MNSIAWINRPAAGSATAGSWGPAPTLPLPCDARGVLLAEGVFETVLVLDGQVRLLEAHLERWRQGAALLALGEPPAWQVVAPLVHEAMQRSGISTGALRLNWCRGSGPRGLGPVEPAQDRTDHLFWLQLSTMRPSFTPVSVIVSPTEVRSATSLLSRCKSFGYASALVARRQAACAGADDALLPSSSGELCCGSSANLLVQIDNGWHTPPLSSGCLPGIMRARALAQGLARETSIQEEDLERSTGALLINSLGCRPIDSKGRAVLPGPRGPEASLRAERLWRDLLAD